ncbi:MAG: hypothetical protein PHD05_05240 [Sphaerochaetaceae bacterium]|nr:hypothetical protein [Sphaerochaetaceae bacterium]
MINFCTLFDSNYIDRGIAMYRSLVRECPSAFVYIIAFDDKCYKVLKKMNLKKAKIISLKEFEDKELLKAKSNRSKVEYMWTCSSSSVYYVLKRFKLKACTYIDADLYFYSNPKVLIDELRSDSVLISEHRYTPKYDQSKISGKYCVQFMTFKNNPLGRGVLNWWKNACLEWCYARPENGKFGDQKYLDDWLTRFKGIHVMQNLGGGVAPWNMQQYKISDKNVLSINNKKVDLIFFHFHGLRILGKIVDLSPYYLPKEFKDEYYGPYLNELLLIRKELLRYNLDLFQNSIVPKMTLKVFLRNILRVLNSEYNIIKLGE